MPYGYKILHKKFQVFSILKIISFGSVLYKASLVSIVSRIRMICKINIVSIARIVNLISEVTPAIYVDSFLLIN